MVKLLHYYLLITAKHNLLIVNWAMLVLRIMQLHSLEVISQTEDSTFKLIEVCPLLYPTCRIQCSTYFYADDTQLYLSILPEEKDNAKR